MSDIRARLRNLRAATRSSVPRREIYVPDESETPNHAYYRQHGTPQPLEVLAPGLVQETPQGSSYVVRTDHPHDHEHGEGILASWLEQTLAGAAVFTNDRRLATVDPRKCLFLDTETTGLNAGAGTLVFLVGVGLFTETGFEVHQFFLRNPGEEPAMLHALRELMNNFEALVTFNGRSFDMPMLASRYTMNRQHLRVDRWPNLDLLHPARRLWKRRLESCRLASLEQSILGVQRTGEDVPGWLIPQLYHEYLQTGDGRQMSRVIYHNLYDILSMVTLAAHLCDTFTRADVRVLPFDDLISLARWYEGLDMMEQAEVTYSAALEASRHDWDRKLCLTALAALMKRIERKTDAAELWQRLAELSPSDPTPRIELAKYHEWTTRDFDQALHWTDAASQANMARVRNWEQQNLQDDILKRRERLVQKMNK